MHSKVRQVTDVIHGTIYISALEHEMMATPFFYRLHDVYQSSTVYMTFPSNRTKRFEHSLGTMEIAGRMFYAAVTNATIDDQKRFLGDLQIQFESILKLLEDRTKLEQIKIYQAESRTLGKLIQKNKCNMPSVIALLKGTAQSAPLADRALCKEEVCFFDLLDQNEKNAMDQIAIYAFLYQCALEALRIAALFHDIGHPPFSHIIESTLQKLYNKDTSHFENDKLNEFKQCLEKYIQCTAVEPILLDHVYGCKKSNDPALHEQIGSHILYNAYRGVLNKMVFEWGKKVSNPNNRLKALYLITVMEFTFGILLEKAPVFASLHRIIDGPVDADRLDYVVRDSQNSGVNWGIVPYDRLISATKFAYKGGTLKLAFPEKVCDDLDDLLVNRYKIFQRINFHHKCVKTSELMQRSVEMLAEDYLVSHEGEEILPEIKNLWGSLGAAFGLDEMENQISQWTDSWLVSALSKALSTLSDPDERTRLTNMSNERSESRLESLYCMLEEVQLNRKRYYPLLKRQRDALKLGEKIIEKAGITKEALDKLCTHEYNKLITQTGDKADSAREALYRIGLLQSEVLPVANFGLLDTLLPDDKTCEQLIEDILQEEQKNNNIQDYFLWNNSGFYKLGVSNSTDITLYRHGNDLYRYDVSTSLMRKLDAQRAGCLWMFAYVCFPEMSENKIEKQIELLFNKIATAIGDSVHNQMNALFDFDHVIKDVS